MKEIGGFFGLELQKGIEYHPHALPLNTARNCLEYVLQAQKIQKLYLPYYICDVMLEPLQKMKIEYGFYHIDQHLRPIFSQGYQENQALLYVNYFGLQQKNVEALAQHHKNLIVDNTQAFFAQPFRHVDTLYSARKFFGVSDGAYLYTDTLLEQELVEDSSYTRMSHLLKRTDLTAEDGYADFLENDRRLTNQPIKQMSKITHALLQNVDYERVKLIRERNFLFIHQHLKDFNQLEIDLEHVEGPMVYPFLTEREELKNALIQHKIYVPTYWKNVVDWVEPDCVEYTLAHTLVPLPIDQRYTTADMNVIVANVLKELS